MEKEIKFSDLSLICKIGIIGGLFYAILFAIGAIIGLISSLL